MQTTTAVSVLWAVAVAVFVGLMVYRARLNNLETDELFLGDHDEESNRKHEHDDIVRRVARIKPYCQGVGGFAALMTIALVGIEVANIAQMLR